MATNPALVATTTTLIAEKRISAQADEKASGGTAISPRVPRLARADINFLAGIIKPGYPTAPYLVDMRRTLLVASMGEKTMESFAYGIGNLVGFQLIVGFMFGIYLAPSIVAVVRGSTQTLAQNASSRAVGC